MDTVQQLKGALAGRYDIDREIGAGGMATVYLARDVRHDRHVALKVLNPELGAILGVERFLAEIRVTANLQHPNLLPLFDSGEVEGLLFYVMPYVEGETLRTRLEREQQLPVDEAVRIAVASASALGYAHSHNVIHRDLKPENILLQAGQPMIADFGIALAVSKAGGARITQTGLSLGTPQYMSPEQATGDRVIDGRSDIYSLAAVVYEMLSGEPPHQGQTVQAVIARVLTERPRNLRIVRPSVPEHVSDAIDRALEKLPADRFATATEFADALSGRATKPALSATQRADRAKSRVSLTNALLASALVLVSAFALWSSRRPESGPRTPARYLLGLPIEPRFTSGTGTDVAISPDGKNVVYVSRREGRNALRIRPIGSMQSRDLVGTDGGLAPFFSADGEWVGFAANGKLRKIPTVGGASIPLADMPFLTGGSWNQQNEIVYCGGNDLMTVSGDGGTPRKVATLDSSSRSYACTWPDFLPDGKAVLVGIARGGLTNVEIAVVTMAGKVAPLGILGVSPHYVRGGYIVFTRADGSLMMQRFDPKRRRLLGAAIPTGEIIQVKFGGATNLTISRDGTAIFLGGASHVVPVLVDFTGKSRHLLDTPREYRIPRFSPDGHRIAFTTNASGIQDLWIYDIPSSTLTRLTTGEDIHQPEWTPDGKRLAYTAVTGETGEDILWQPVDGSSPAEALINAPGDQYDASWTPDGKTLVYMYDDPDPAHPSIGVLRMDDRIPRPWLATPDQERSSRVSPKGDRIAYASDASGRMEVYVRPFPGAGGRLQVSSGGGAEPMWAADGRTLYYRDNEKMMVATLGTSPELTVVTRKLVFEAPYFGDGTHTFYDLAPDGKSFLMFKAAEDLTQFLVVVNWDEELRRRAQMSAAK